MSESRKMVCKHNLRPRVSGLATLVLAGTPFDESWIDKDSKQQMLDKGDLEYVGGAVSEQKKEDVLPKEKKNPSLNDLMAQAKERYGVDLGKEFNSKKKVLDEMARLKAAKAPKGIFKVPQEDLEGFNLDELDAMHADICAKHDLPAPDLFESVEQGIAKLTGASE